MVSGLWSVALALALAAGLTPDQNRPQIAIECAAPAVCVRVYTPTHAHTQSHNGAAAWTMNAEGDDPT